MLKLKLQYFGHQMQRSDPLEKTLMLGKTEGRRRSGWQRMRWLDGWHHQLNRHEFEQALGDGDGQGGLARCSAWGLRESDTTERWNSSHSLLVYTRGRNTRTSAASQEGTERVMATRRIQRAAASSDKDPSVCLPWRGWLLSGTCRCWALNSPVELALSIPDI